MGIGTQESESVVWQRPVTLQTILAKDGKAEPRKAETDFTVGVSASRKCESLRRWVGWAMNSGPLSLRTHRGTPRIANSSASVSITSSLVILRLTFKARHSRVCSSTIDSHFKV